LFRKSIKNLFKYLSVYSSERFNNYILVLCFHDINDKPSKFQKKYNLNLKVDSFKKLLNNLSKNHHFIHPNELNNNKIIHGRNVLITFDDGFLGSFNNAIPILNEFNIPAIYFLNMNSIINNLPLISSFSSYIEENYSILENISKDFYLKINIEQYNNFFKKYSNLLNEIFLYQGELIKYKDLVQYSHNKNIFFANHLFDHFNVLNLDYYQINNLYLKNFRELKKFKNFINYFSFPNGIPKIAFTKQQAIYIRKNFNPYKIFYSSRKFNFRNNYYLERVAISDDFSNLKYLEYLKLKTKINIFNL